MLVPIKGFEDYLINSSGEVYSTKSNKFLTPAPNSSGYLQIFFTVDNVRHTFLIHRLLAFCFKGLPCLYSDLEVDHIDTNVLNNDLDNLQILDKDKHWVKTIIDRGFSSEVKFCSCGKRLYKRFHTSCRGCSTNKNNISLEDIIYWVKTYSWSRASRELDMSDNGLRKLYKRLSGLDPKDLK